MENSVLQSKGVLAVRGSSHTHGDPGVAAALLAAYRFFGIGPTALLNLFLGQRFEFEAIQFAQNGANVCVIPDFASLDLLEHESLDGFLDALPFAQIENRFDHPFSLRLFGADPAFAGVPIITECVKETF